MLKGITWLMLKGIAWLMLKGIAWLMLKGIAWLMLKGYSLSFIRSNHAHTGGPQTTHTYLASDLPPMNDLWKLHDTPLYQPSNHGYTT